MRVRTKRQPGGYKTRLEVEKLDLDNEIYVSSQSGGCQSGGSYLYKDDVPRLIQALKWAIT